MTACNLNIHQIIVVTRYSMSRTLHSIQLYCIGKVPIPKVLLKITRYLYAVGLLVIVLSVYICSRYGCLHAGWSTGGRILSIRRLSNAYTWGCISRCTWNIPLTCHHKRQGAREGFLSRRVAFSYYQLTFKRLWLSTQLRRLRIRLINRITSRIWTSVD